MNNQLDFATLALKGKRYAEAESIYMQMVNTENSVEAWCGVGICKLYQLTENRTMDEVVFCFEKAKQSNPSLSKEIEEQLVMHAGIVLNTYSQIIVATAQQAAKEKGKAQLGAALAAVSFVGGMNSSKAFSTIAALGGTGAGVGVAVDSLNKMGDLQAMSQLIMSKCDEIYRSVKGFCSQDNQAVVDFESNVLSLRANLSNVLSTDSSSTIDSHSKKAILYLWLFFPYGLYHMWKHKIWSKNTRYAITFFFVLVILMAVLGDKK